MLECSHRVGPDDLRRRPTACYILSKCSSRVRGNLYARFVAWIIQATRRVTRETCLELIPAYVLRL